MLATTEKNAKNRLVTFRKYFFPQF